MIKVDEVKQFLDSLSNKDQAGNTFTVNEFNLWLRRAIDALFSKEYGLPEDYKPGAPLPNIGYELTQRIKDDLRVFKERPVLNVDANGFMVIPADYVHYTAIDYLKITNQVGQNPNVEDFEVAVIDDNKWSSRKRRKVKVADKDNPICNFQAAVIEFFPKDLMKVRFTYLRYPKEPVWAFTLVDDVEIFDASSSVDVELPENLTNDLTTIMVNYLAVKTKDEGLLAYARGVMNLGK